MTEPSVERTFASIAVGESAKIERTIREDDIQAFADLSGDHNPLHMDVQYAQTTVFGERVVHGMFLAALVSQLVGMKLPGRNALLVKESLEFKKPVHAGDTIVVSGRVATKSESTGLIELEITVTCAHVIVASGNVHVRVLQ